MQIAAGHLTLNVLPRLVPLRASSRPHLRGGAIARSASKPSCRSMAGLTSAMADIASKAADTVKSVAKSFDPKAGEAAPMHGRTAVVTGGNVGLGYETGLAIAKAGGHVVLAVRNPEKGEQAVEMIQKEVDAVNGGGKVESMQCDLASLRSVYDFAQNFISRNKQLHVLVNNAGEFAPEDQITEDGFEVTTATNHMGNFYLTQLLLDPLKAGAPSRIVWVTSPSETSTADIDFDNLEGVGKQSDVAMYGLTKLYNIMSMREFQKRLVGTGVETFAAQPGIAKTSIFGKLDQPNINKPAATLLANVGPLIGQTPEEGARGITYAATSPDMQGKGGDIEHIVGPFYSTLGPATPHGLSNIANLGNTGERPAQNEQAYDEDKVKRLYDETARILSHKIKEFDADRKWA